MATQSFSAQYSTVARSLYRASYPALPFLLIWRRMTKAYEELRRFSRATAEGRHHIEASQGDSRRGLETVDLHVPLVWVA